MFFVYILKSKKDEKLYIGYSSNLRERIKAHIQGRVASTKNRRPLIIIYYEAYSDMQDAKNREIFLKSGSGHRFLKNQLRIYFEKHPDAM
jgi:putative endonuclease